MANTSKPQCSWDCGIDIDGLSKEDQARIKKIGLDKWIDEIIANPKKVKKTSEQGTRAKKTDSY